MSGLTPDEINAIWDEVLDDADFVSCKLGAGDAEDRPDPQTAAIEQWGFVIAGRLGQIEALISKYIESQEARW